MRIIPSSVYPKPVSVKPQEFKTNTVKTYPNDVYFGNRQYIKDLTQTSANNIEDKKIENLTIVRPNVLTRMLNKDETFGIYNSEIDNIVGYRKCILSLLSSKIKNISNFDTVFVDSDTDNITKVHDVHIGSNGCCFSKYSTIENYFSKQDDLAAPKVNYIFADYVTAADESEVDYIKSHLTYLATGAKIKNIETNALIIKPFSKYTYDKDYQYEPVTVEKAAVTKENITSLNNKLFKDKRHEFYELSYTSKENAYADVEYCNIGELSCKKLNAKKANIKTADAEKCDNIIESNIDNLTTSAVKKIQNSRIKNLNITSGKFILNIDKESKINNIKFEKPNGILTVKNSGQYIPQVNITNGTAEYDFENITLDKFSTGNNFQAGNNVNIKTLEIEDDNATVVLSGNANVENIHFKHHGQVILRADKSTGKYPDINKIKVENGIIVKDYPLKGLEKVAGMEELKRQLREDVIEPLKNPELYKKYCLDV